MMPNEVVIALGSNIDPEANLDLALKELKKRFKISKLSRWIRTKPLGIQDIIIVSGDVATKSQTQVPAIWVNNELKLLEDSKTNGIARRIIIE